MGGAGTNVLNHFERINCYLFNMLRLNKIIKRLLLLDLFFPVRLYTLQIALLGSCYPGKKIAALRIRNKRYTFVAKYTQC